MTPEQLRKIIDERLGKDEIKTIYFDLGVDADMPPSDSKSELIRSLLLHLGRRNRLTEVADWLKKNRPDIQIDNNQATAIETNSNTWLVGGAVVGVVLLMLALIWLFSGDGNEDTSLPTEVDKPTDTFGSSEATETSIAIAQVEDTEAPLPTSTNTPTTIPSTSTPTRTRIPPTETPTITPTLEAECLDGILVNDICLFVNYVCEFTQTDNQYLNNNTDGVGFIHISLKIDNQSGEPYFHEHDLQSSIQLFDDLGNEYKPIRNSTTAVSMEVANDLSQEFWTTQQPSPSGLELLPFDGPIVPEATTLTFRFVQFGAFEGELDFPKPDPSLAEGDWLSCRQSDAGS